MFSMSACQVILTSGFHFCRLKMLGFIMETYRYHQRVRLCWKLVMRGIPTWMNELHGHFLSKGMLLLRPQLRFLLKIIYFYKMLYKTYFMSLIYLPHHVFDLGYWQHFIAHISYYWELMVLWQDLVIILEAMRIIAVALSPVTPNLSWRIYEQLGYSKEQFDSANWVSLS